MTNSIDPSRPRSSSSLLRYGLVGAANNLLGYLAYLALTWRHVEPKLAMTLLYILACTIGFLGNRKWTFAYRGSMLWSALRYGIAHFMGYLLNLSLLLIFSDHIGYPHQYVQAVAIFVVAIFLYLVFRYFVFRGITAPEVDTK